MPWSAEEQEQARRLMKPFPRSERKTGIRDVLAAMGLVSSPLDLLPREAQGVRPDFGMTGAGLGMARRHPGEYLPGEASQTDTANALWGIVESAGMENLPGIGPHKLEQRVPGGRSRNGGVWDMTRDQFLGSPQITNDRNAADLTPKLTKSAADAPAEPFGKYTIRRGASTYVVMDGERPVASYDGDTLVVAKPYRGRGIATDLVYEFRTQNPDVPPAKQRTKAAQAIQEKVWNRIESERKK